MWTRSHSPSAPSPRPRSSGQCGSTSAAGGAGTVGSGRSSGGAAPGAPRGGQMAKCDEKCDDCGMTLNHYCMACHTGGYPAGRLYDLYQEPAREAEGDTEPARQPASDRRRRHDGREGHGVEEGISYEHHAKVRSLWSNDHNEALLRDYDAASRNGRI